MAYRPELDGLRAVAVSLVLLFHAQSTLFAGGFVGVDTFFVISGYLIASLIRKEIAAGKFSIVGFYERRIRRILPAMVLVMATTLALGAFVLLPEDFRKLASSAAYASAFIANVHFARAVDYFYDESAGYPLLHLWSLSVEEQFYLVAPFVLLLLYRWRSKHLAALLVLITAAFLAASELEVLWRPAFAYYSSLGRAFELLLGVSLSWAAIAAPPRQSLSARVLPPVGFASILAAAMYFDRTTAFPGVAALLPCAGAASIIAFTRPDVGLGRILASRPIVALGLISYPLYLWHWPLHVLARQYFARDLTNAETGLIIASAVVLAWATHRWLEQPLKAAWPRLPRMLRWGCPGAALSLVVLAAIGIRHADGLPSRLPPDARRLLAAGEGRPWGPPGCHNSDRRAPGFAARCAIGSTAPGSMAFAIWGDSMANSLSTMISQLAGEHRLKGLQISSSGCPPLLGVSQRIRREVTGCEAANAAVPDILGRLGIRRVILIANWGWYSRRRGFKGNAWTVGLYSDHAATQSIPVEQALIDTVETLQARKITVSIVGPIPEIGWSPPDVLAVEAWHGSAGAAEPTLAEFSAWQRNVLATLHTLESKDVQVVYPHRLLCAEICRVQRGGEPLYADSEHMTLPGLQEIRPALAWLFQRPIAGRR